MSFKMNELSNKERTVLAYGIWGIVVVINLLIVLPAAMKIIHAGTDMSHLSSIGGQTVAEAYYQMHGQVYIGFGRIIMAVDFVIGLVLSLFGWYIYQPIIEERKIKVLENQNTSIDQHMGFCPKCGKERKGNDRFCQKCGHEYE